MAKKVLLVEDDALIRQGLRDMLGISGYDVFTAINGQDGYNKALNIKPDLILLDIFMPIMTGLEMLEKLRLDSWGKNVPVIILTNDSDVYAEKEAVLDEASDYVLKSNTSSENLLQRIEKAITTNTN